MNEPMFFSEWVFYANESEKIKAYEYLELWKYFLMKKMRENLLVDEQITDRKNIFETGENTLAIKISVKKVE